MSNDEVKLIDEAVEYVTKGDLVQVCLETEDMLNGLRHAVNTQAEVIACHRYLLERFMPAPALAAAVNDYVKLREQAIAEEMAKETASGDPAKAN